MKSPFLLGRLPFDLLGIRLKLGETAFASRVAAARSVERQLTHVHSLVAQKKTVAAAAKVAATTLSPATLQGLYAPWRSEGLAALIRRECGPLLEPASDADEAPSPSPRVGRPLADGSDGLLQVSARMTGLLPVLLDHLPSRFERFIEAFLGDGALFFQLRPADAVLIDRDPDIVNLFQVAHKDPGGLAKECRQHRVDPEAFYRLKGRRPETLGPIARAARTIMLSRVGGYSSPRIARQKLFTTFPSGGRGWSAAEEEAVHRASAALGAAKLLCGDFSECVRHARAKDLVFLDPPHDLLPGRRRPKSADSDFREGDQGRVAQVMRELDRRGCYVLASNADTPRVRQLYQGFKVTELNGMRLVGDHGPRRERAVELLIQNY